MPSNIIKIGYTFNGEAFEYSTKVDAYHDLENATRELQMILIEQVLELKPHCIERSTEISMFTTYQPGSIQTPEQGHVMPWLNLIHAANEIDPKMFGEPVSNVDGVETYEHATVRHNDNDTVTVTAISKHGNMILRQAAEEIGL